MIVLDLLWWVGWAWCGLWAALPLLFVPLVGPVWAIVIGAVLAPWTALLGMAGVHRLLPHSESGTFHLPGDPGSVRWALRGWAPSVYLTLFQPLFFNSVAFQRIALRAFGARLGAGAWLTSRTVAREPHRLRVGAGSLIGEFAHLACSYQPRPGVLVVADITIGAASLVAAHCHLAPGVTVGSRCVLEHAVGVGAGTTIGDDSRVGASTVVYNRARIGRGVTIGKHCLIPAGAVVADGARIPDGTILSAPASRPLRQVAP
jgi:acetyltransferase-like isoleucine patch superfamily enzyme